MRLIDADALIKDEEAPMLWDVCPDAEIAELLEWQRWMDKVINAPTIAELPFITNKPVKMKGRRSERQKFLQEFMKHHEVYVTIAENGEPVVRVDNKTDGD